MPPIYVRTLKDYLDGGYTLTVYCEAWVPGIEPCRHSAPLNIKALIERFGPDFEDFDYLRAALTCSKCGAKSVAFRLSPLPPSKMMQTAKLWTGAALDWKG